MGVNVLSNMGAGMRDCNTNCNKDKLWELGDYNKGPRSCLESHRSFPQF